MPAPQAATNAKPVAGVWGVETDADVIILMPNVELNGTAHDAHKPKS
ncbi:hypothetical protein [Undibacterium parvum]|nr:hypothetical protein [Undibacterium parvum]